MTSSAGPITDERRIVLEAQSVTRQFGGLTAVNRVDLQLREGESLGLIGANGAGKTTLFNMLSGFDRPSEGDIQLHGRSMLGSSRHEIVRSGLARTFQIVRPFAALTVTDNVRVPLTVRGLRNSDLEIPRILNAVGLAHLANVPASLLSEGDLKRLELARALGTNPNVLLLDEPFAGLSPNEIQRLCETISALHASGMSLLIVEHKIGTLAKLCQRIVALHRGTVIADGSPQEVISSPQVVEAYLGGALE